MALTYHLIYEGPLRAQFPFNLFFPPKHLYSYSPHFSLPPSSRKISFLQKNICSQVIDSVVVTMLCVICEIGGEPNSAYESIFGRVKSSLEWELKMWTIHPCSGGPYAYVFSVGDDNPDVAVISSFKLGEQLLNLSIAFDNDEDKDKLLHHFPDEILRNFLNWKTDLEMKQIIKGLLWEIKC